MVFKPYGCLLFYRSFSVIKLENSSAISVVEFMKTPKRLNF